ncbi:MAG: nuclear transport factor 2 family protein [bacterium]|nr:nuclear transport factor 2 family protein [bacterium]
MKTGQNRENRSACRLRSIFGALATALLVGACSSGAIEATPQDSGDPASRKAVRAAVLEFSRLADQQRAGRLEAILHPRFRVWAQIKGKAGVLALSRGEYLAKIRAKEFGGDVRRVTIHSIQVRGDLALVVASSRGARAVFESSYHLVRGAQGWQLTNDMAEVTFLK